MFKQKQENREGNTPLGELRRLFTDIQLQCSNCLSHALLDSTFSLTLKQQNYLITRNVYSISHQTTHSTFLPGRNVFRWCRSRWNFPDTLTEIFVCINALLGSFWLTSENSFSKQRQQFNLGLFTAYRRMSGPWKFDYLILLLYCGSAISLSCVLWDGAQSFRCCLNL